MLIVLALAEIRKGKLVRKADKFFGVFRTTL